MLGVLGVASTAPLLKPVGSTVLGSFRMVTESNRIAFWMRGKERWVVDGADFDGPSRVTVSRADKDVVVSLAGASFPGTDLTADFSARLTPGLSGWTMRFRSRLGFDVEAPFEAWLMGRRALVTNSAFSARVGLNSLSPIVEVAGSARVSFSPDWTLRLTGRNIVHVRTSGIDVRGDNISLRVLSPATPSLFAKPTRRRSLLSVERTDADWQISPRLHDGPEWAIHASPNAFDRILVETAAPGRAGRAPLRSRRAFAVCAECTDSRRHAVSVRPAECCSSIGSEHFEIALGDPRYAVTISCSGGHAAVASGYLKGAGWLRTDDFSIKVGKAQDDGATFCLTASGDKLESVECTLDLLETMLHPDDPDLIVRPVALAEPTPLALRYGKRRPPASAGDNLFIRASGDVGRSSAALRLAVAPVELIRPEDFAVLRFEFQNMSVQTRGGQRYVVPDGGASYLIAQFQAQHITEQALFEASDSTTDGMSLEEAVDESGVSGSSSQTKDTSAGSDDPKNFPPPVAARMSGVSRLVFRVPSTRTIPFTLEGLLAACSELDMNLAGNALPPDKPDLFIYDFDLGGILDTSESNLTIRRADMNRAGVSLWTTLQTDTTQTQNVRRGGLNVRGNRRAAFVNQRVRNTAAVIDEVESTAQTTTARSLIRNYRNERLAATSSVGQIIGSAKDQLAVADTLADNIANLVLAPTRPEPPNGTTTAIEAPYRLYMSPNRYNAWAHSPTAKASPEGIFELWHTRLGVRSGESGVFEGNHWARAMRAIWSPDFREQAINGPAPANDPFRMSLDGSDRHNLVHLTSNFFLPDWEPRPVDVRQFMLSSLGAWINVRGDFGPNGDDLPGGLAVLEWVHRATMARDHYVKVVYAGYLFPWGHQASLIKVTERKFAPHPTNSNSKVAYLFQRMYIVVREPLKVQRTGIPSLDRQNPFKSARILTLNTPNLDKPEATDYPEPNGNEQALFWPRVGGTDFLFNMRLEDLEGGLHEVTMPLAFVRKDEVDKQLANNPGAALEDLIDDFNNGTGSAKQARRTRAFNGQTVAFADSTMPGDTTFETDTVTFGADSVSTRPGFAPVLRSATAVVPAVKQLVGDETPVPVKFYERYLDGGFSSAGPNKNTGEVFLALITDAADDAVTPEMASAVKLFDVNFSSQGDRSGGLVQPNMRVQGLSRVKGLVSGAGKAALDTFANGDFQPASFFGAPPSEGGPALDAGDVELPTDLFPKLFGIINLWDIIESTGMDGPGAPKFITETVGVVEDFLAAFDTLRSLMQTGLNAAAALQSHVQSIEQDLQNIENDFSNMTADSFPGQLPTHLNDLLTHVDGLLGAIPGANLQGALRREAEKLLGDIKSVLQDSGFLDAARAFTMALEAIIQKKIRLEWKPPLKSFGIPNAPPIFDASGLKNNNDASLTLGVEMKAEGGGPGSAPSLDVFCSLEDFTLDLVPIPGGTAANLFTRILRIGFDRIQFFGGSATKPGVDVVMAGIEFQGILGFVETLRNLIPLDGFSDPPYIDVDASGIRAGFDFDVPGVAVGVFSLQNISLGAELKVPFIGESIEVSFNFNRPENPCLLSVWVFGGGAYFGVTITPRGLRMIRAAFEFGATVSLNFGVASGGVYVMAGVYFEYIIAQADGEEDSMTLIGYLRLGGHVSVLGLISLSIEMRMEIGYENGKAVGRATIQVEVEILFFSATVSISYEKKFKGGNGDPTFLQMMGDPYLEPVQDQMVDPWDMYARAFA